jgi:hypothetical protein
MEGLTEGKINECINNVFRSAKSQQKRKSCKPQPLQSTINISQQPLRSSMNISQQPSQSSVNSSQNLSKKKHPVVVIKKMFVQTKSKSLNDVKHYLHFHCRLIGFHRH